MSHQHNSQRKRFTAWPQRRLIGLWNICWAFSVLTIYAADPMTVVTAVTRTVCPGIENMSRFWRDWSESLDGDHRIHFVALKLQVYQSMYNSATASEFLWHFGGTPNAAHTRQVVLEVRYMPSVDIVDMFGRLYSELRRACGDLHAHTASHSTSGQIGIHIRDVGIPQPTLGRGFWPHCDRA